MITNGSVTYANNISWGMINNEVFVFDEEIKKIFLLKGVEKDIWLIIENNNQIADITDLLLKSGLINDNKIFEIIEKLVRKNLVRNSNL